MLDTIDRERYTILYEKWGKIKAPSMSVGDAPTQAGTSTGIYVGATLPANYQSRATKIVKMWLPASKFLVSMA